MTQEIEPKVLKVQKNALVKSWGTNILTANLDIRLTNARDRSAALDFCKVITKEVKLAEREAKKRAAKRAKK